MSKKNRGKKKKKITLISIIIFILLLLISVGMFGLVISLGVLPLKYLILLLVVLGFIYFGIGKVVFSKKIRVWVKITIDVICVILIGLYLFGYYYLNSTLNFMNNIKADDYQIETFYVLVNKDSKYEDINDLKNKTLGIIKERNNNYNKALKEVKKKVKINEKEYNDYVDISKDLLNDEIDAMLLSSSYKSILEDLLSDFNSNIKIIKTIDIKTKSQVKVNKKNVTKESFNIYISGVDVYGDVTTLARSDVNMIITVNPKTHNILLTSIPRDYYVDLYGTNSKDKLTHAGMYGIESSINSVGNLLDLDIDYYVKVNFTSVINLVDAIGGIDVYSDTAFTSAIDGNCYYRYGTNHLNGKCALAYSRERYAYIDGDRHRVKNQQDVIAAIMNKALSSKTLITKYTNILESMGNSFQTSMPTDSIYDLINMQLNSMPSWNFDTYSLNGYDSNNTTYTFGSQQLYVMEPDMSTVKTAKDKIDYVMGN